jgi:hypothetical protein
MEAEAARWKKWILRPGGHKGRIAIAATATHILFSSLTEQLITRTTPSLTVFTAEHAPL